MGFVDFLCVCAAMIAIYHRKQIFLSFFVRFCNGQKSNRSVTKILPKESNAMTSQYAILAQKSLKIAVRKKFIFGSLQFIVDGSRQISAASSCCAYWAVSWMTCDT